VATDIHLDQPKSWFLPKPTFTTETKEIKPTQRDWASKCKLDEDENNIPTEDVGGEPQIPLGGKNKKWLEKKGQERKHHLSHLEAKQLWGKKMIPGSTVCSIF
jgi:hypothetical protein